MKRLLLLLLLLQPVLAIDVSADEQSNDTIWVYDPSTGVSYPAMKTNIVWVDSYGRTENETRYVLNKTEGVEKLVVEHKIDIEGNKTIIVYDADMVRAYQALVAEQRVNITRLQSELEKKNKQLAEYISYKKKNIELQQNISKLNNQITTLKAENELLKQQNEQYKDLITDLINKQSNETKEGYISAYNEWKKDVGNFKTALIFGGIVCIILGILLIKEKMRYEIPL